MLKPLTVGQNKPWKILKEMGLSDHFTCLLKNLYVGQEATVRTRHETTGWFKIGRGVQHGCILSPCLLKFDAVCVCVCVSRSVMQKCWAGWITSWNQDCWEKYQRLKWCRWYHSNRRKWRETKESLDEGKKRVKKVAQNSTLQKLRSCHPILSLHGK